MKRLALALILVACRGGSSSAPPEPPPAAVPHATLAFSNVRVFDGEHVIPEADVLVDGETIVAVAPSIAIPAGVPVIDGAGKTLLPGLFDGHVHAYDASSLEQALAFGVTTMLDMFSVPSEVKKLKADDQPNRAALLSAGTLATAPKGHGTEYGLEIPTITSPEEAAAFVDARIAEGSDYLKIVLDDGSAYGITIPTISPATLEALVVAAHARKKLAVVHVGDRDDARTAIERGADGIVHLFRDALPADDFGALVASKHAFVTPTLAVLRSVCHEPSTIADDPAIAPFLGPDAKATLAQEFPMKATCPPGVVAATIAQLRDAKVPILAGTDAPNAGTTYGASVHDELAALVEAGLTPTAALAGATALPAQRFGLTDRGRIAVGLRADLVLVDGDPTTTITATRAIAGVWRGGTRLDRDAYRARIAEANRQAALPIVLGPISDFEDGTTATRFGQAWIVSTDEMTGGTSKATLTVVDEPGSGHAMQIAGEVTANPSGTWAGALFSPGSRAFTAVDLSSKKLAFSARSDGKTTYTVMVFSEKLGRSPAMKTFKPGTKLTPMTFRWKDFHLDGKDIQALLIGRVEPGAFSLVIDDVALR